MACPWASMTDEMPVIRRGLLKISCRWYLRLGLNTGILLVVAVDFFMLTPHENRQETTSDGQSLVIVHGDRCCTAGIAFLERLFHRLTISPSIGQLTVSQNPTVQS